MCVWWEGKEEKSSWCRAISCYTCIVYVCVCVRARVPRRRWQPVDNTDPTWRRRRWWRFYINRSIYHPSRAGVGVVITAADVVRVCVYKSVLHGFSSFFRVPYKRAGAWDTVDNVRITHCVYCGDTDGLGCRGLEGEGNPYYSKRFDAWRRFAPSLSPPCQNNI